MLHNYFTSFLDYCKNANFSERSIESLAFRLNEFSNFIKTVDSPSIQVIEYQQLTQFVADFISPSASVKNSSLDTAPVFSFSVIVYAPIITRSIQFFLAVFW